MKKTLYFFELLILTTSIAVSNTNQNYAEKMVESYTKRFQDNNGSLKESIGVYTKSFTYLDNKLVWYIIYNKAELIQLTIKKQNLSLMDATKYINSQEFHQKIINKQKNNNIIQLCNSSHPLSQLIKNGLVFSLNVDWDNGEKFIRYNYTQKTCDEANTIANKRYEAQKKKLIKKNNNTLYYLEIFKTKIKNKKQALKAYIKIRKKILLPDESFKILGKNLNFGKELNYKIISGRSKIIKYKLPNGEYNYIKIIKVQKSTPENNSSVEKDTIEVSKNDCIKLYGKKVFKNMQELDTLMSDEGNALKKCKRDIINKNNPTATP